MNINELAARFKLWKDRPDIFVEEVFGAKPDLWQQKILQAFPTQQRIALKACRGPGKTCVLAWLAWNFLLTRPHPKIVATSITADNLSDNLWSEMALWQSRSPLLKEMFTYTKTRIFSKEHPETWWMSARPWSKSANAEEQGNTLAGLHADYALCLADESGGIPEAVMASVDAMLSSCVEGHIVQAGNPTHLSGPLYNACTRDRHLWHVVEISSAPGDPNRTPRVKIEWANEQIQKYGIDSPWVLVNVFGQFPPTSFNALISVEEVEDAMKRLYAEQDYQNHPKVLGVDVARDGGDSSVIFPRQGLQTFKPMQFRNIHGPEGAGHAARKYRQWQADAIMVDATGGTGSSWIDQLMLLGIPPISVQFAGKASNERYANKRSEMIFELVEWIKRGGALYPVKELVAELTQSTYTFKGDKMILEPKDLLKAKIGRSPDFLDALACTFHSTVEKKPEYVDGWKISDVRTSPVQRYGDYRPLSREYIQRGKKY